MDIIGPVGWKLTLFIISLSMSDPEQSNYDIVGDELARGVINRGLWARALAETGADDSRAKARYITLRVEQLKCENAAAESDVVPSEIDPPPGEIGSSSVVQAPTSANRPKQGGLWRTALPIFSICIILFCVPHLAWIHLDPVSILGVAFTYTILAWLLFHAVFTQGRRKAAWLSFLTIFVSFTVGGIISNRVAGHRDRKALAVIQARTGRTMEAMAAARNQYVTERDRLSDLILDPERLKRSPSECRTYANQLQPNLTAYQSVIAKLAPQCREGIVHSSMPESVKRGMLQAFDKSQATVLPIQNAMTKLEADATAEICAMVDQLTTIDGWSYSDDQFIFSDDKESERFNGHVARISDLNKQYELRSVELAQLTKELAKAADAP